MPPEDIATLEQVVSEPDGSGPEEGDAASKETEELDYKAEYERLSAELTAERTAREKQEKDQRARDIYLLTEKQKQDVQTRIAENTDAILAKVESGELTRAEARTAISTGTATIQNEATASLTQQTLEATLVDAEATLKQQSVALGLGEELEDERANTVRLFWNEAVAAFRKGKFETAEVRRDDALKEIKRLGDQLKGGAKKGSLSLNDRAPGSTTVGMGDEAIWRAYGRGEPSITWERARAAGRRLGVTE